MNSYSYKDHLRFIYQKFLIFEKPNIAIIIVCIIVTAATSGAHMLLIEPVFDHIYRSNDHYLLYILAVSLIIISIIRAIAIFTQQYLYNHIGMRMVNQLQQQLVHQYLYHDHSDRAPIDAAQTIANDSLALLQSFIANILQLIRNVATIAVMVAVVFYHHWQLAIIALGVMPLSAAILIVFGRRLRKKVRVVRADISQMTTICNEIFQALADVIAANLQDKCQAQLQQQWLNINHTRYKVAQLIALGKLILNCLRALIIATLLLLGGYFISIDSMSISQFAAFLIALGLLYRPIVALFTINSQLQIGMASLDRLRILSDRLMPKYHDGIVENSHAENSHRMRLDNISMMNDNTLILDDISYQLPNAGLVMIRGASGAGKTSLLKLVAGIIEAPQHTDIKGTLYINDHDARHLGAGLHRGICYAPQQPCLWDMSLRDNIILNEHENSHALQQAIDIAQCRDIINKIGGLHQTIGEDGQLLSGGQRQRVGLARALYAAINNNYHILLFDEPTSALDKNTRHDFINHITTISKSKLVVMVTHQEYDITAQYHPITTITMDKGKIIS